MELIKIDLPLPDVVTSLNTKMKDVLNVLEYDEAKFSIAGGCLSNLYMGREMRDIDIFLEYPCENDSPDIKQLEKIFGAPIEIVERIIDDGYDFIQHPLLYRLEYMGYPVDLVFCNNLNRIYDFDIRMRQFYLLDGEVFTTKNAISDIQNQLLVISSPCSPLTSYVRLHHFKEELGFQIDRKSEQILLHLINKRCYLAIGIEKFINNKKSLNPVARKKLLEWVQLNGKNDGIETILSVNEVSHSISEELIHFIELELSHSHGIERNIYCSDKGFWGNNFEKIKDYQPKFIIQPFNDSFSYKDIQESITPCFNKLFSYMKAIRLKNLVTGKHVARHSFENPLDSFDSHKKITVDHKTYMTLFDLVYKMLERKEYEQLITYFDLATQHENTVEIFIEEILLEFKGHKNINLNIQHLRHLHSGYVEVKPLPYYLNSMSIDEYLEGEKKLIDISIYNQKAERVATFGTFQVNFSEDGSYSSLEVILNASHLELTFFKEMIERKIEDYIEITSKKDGD